jgi:hypothetical protein
MTYLIFLLCGLGLGSFLGFAAQSAITEYREKRRSELQKEEQKSLLLNNLAIELNENLLLSQRTDLLWAKRPLSTDAYSEVRKGAGLFQVSFLNALALAYLRISEYNNIISQLRSSARFSAGGYNDRLAGLAGEIREAILNIKDTHYLPGSVSSDGMQRAA